MTLRRNGFWVVIALAAACLATGCSAPSDADGEVTTLGHLPAAPARLASARPLVVDTDLGADDLVALALLLRRPDFDVLAVTVAATGLVGCVDAPAIVTDLAVAAAAAPPLVTCGRSDPGPRGREMPADWRTAAAGGGGLPEAPSAVRYFSPAPRTSQPAARLLASLARQTDGLTVLALGPLTNLADLAASDPAAFARLRAVQVMGGVLDGPGESGVGEWNAAADPASFDAVLAAARTGRPALTVVPLDAVPTGTPPELTGPVVGSITAAADLPAWWDAATAAALVDGGASTRTSGAFSLGGSEPGRLWRNGDGRVHVVRHLDDARVRAVYASAFPRQ